MTIFEEQIQKYIDKIIEVYAEKRQRDLGAAFKL